MELEKLVKTQSELIEELKSKQVEMTSALDWKQVHIKAAIAKQKSMKDLPSQAQRGSCPWTHHSVCPPQTW